MRTLLMASTLVSLLIATPCIAESDNAFQESFTGGTEGWHVARHRGTHPWFDTDWSADQVVMNKGLSLGLSPQIGQLKRFVGGSVRRLQTTGFGRYEAVMQPARGAGLITGFFTYTGPHYGTRHDEIDIEFLGKDTTRIHLAIFVDGVLTNRFIDLGFDAADAPHHYAFDWRPDVVRWYVDGQLLHEISAADQPLPTIPGHVFANIWAADPEIAGWADLADPDLSGVSQVFCLSFTPLADLGSSADTLPQKLTCREPAPQPSG
ncbi:MAG: family 16 glycosylhydrolase [Pseudomonadota bacterium]